MSSEAHTGKKKRQKRKGSNDKRRTVRCGIVQAKGWMKKSPIYCRVGQKEEKTFQPKPEKRSAGESDVPVGWDA